MAGKNRQVTLNPVLSGTTKPTWNCSPLNWDWREFEPVVSFNEGPAPLRCIDARGCIQIFNEQHLVSDLTVDQLVHRAASQKKTVSPGAHSFCLALDNVGHRIVSRIAAS